MNHIIVNEPAREIRAEARRRLKGNWLQVTMGVGLAYVLNMMVPEFFVDCIPFGRVSRWNEVLQENVYTSFPGSLYTIFFTGVFTLGICHFLLQFVRTRVIDNSGIFRGFDFYMKTLGLFLYMSLLTFLWTLLLIIPGIIAAYRYSQAFYILADDPSKSVTQCIDESKAMMVGNKANMFVLNLTFIGWLLLAAIPAGILESIVSTNVGIGYFLTSFVGMIPMYFALTYFNVADTIFYEIISGHLVRKGSPEAMAAMARMQQQAETKATPAEAETSAPTVVPAQTDAQTAAPAQTDAPASAAAKSSFGKPKVQMKKPAWKTLKNKKAAATVKPGKGKRVTTTKSLVGKKSRNTRG